MAQDQAAIDINRVDTTQMFTLGAEYFEPEIARGTHPVTGTVDAGPCKWVYVFNDEAAAHFVAGDIIVRDTITPTFDGILMAAGTPYPAVRVLGVAQHVIPDGCFGWIKSKGVGSVLAGVANLANDTALCTGGNVAGSGLDFAANHEHEILGLTIVGALSTFLATCWINCPGA